MILPMYGARCSQILKLSLIRSPICSKLIQKQTPLALICHNRQFSWASMLETQASWFKSLSESRPVEFAQEFNENFHDLTGLPWWGSIILSTFIVRSCVTLPLSVYQVRYSQVFYVLVYLYSLIYYYLIWGIDLIRLSSLHM
jgi:membrane protein insertase Oxa1/YidC/SpoIIIJ